ncbi:hypothetical protein MFUR16E_16965 [Methylobacterium fujisawaense]
MRSSPAGLMEGNLEIAIGRTIGVVKSYLGSSNPNRKRIIMDVSTALRWIDRNAVGIVRTEREIAKHLIRSANDVVLVYYDRENHAFRLLTTEQKRRLFPALTKNLLRKGSLTPEYNTLFVFHDGDTLISAGLQWDIDFLSTVYRWKKTNNIIVLQILYDLIPIIMPEYCVPGMDVLFPRFIMDTIWTADVVYAISDSTAAAFTSYAKALKIDRMPLVRRIRLGCDIPVSREDSELECVHGLDTRKFVLYVSTIEPRKNHRMLFDIWRLLVATRRDDIPKLVLVGSKGWSTEDLFEIIERCPCIYPDKIVILKDVSDRDLSWMYANALFSLYPSIHEGWGLPIAESLAHGTPCIASNSSSMPEVAGAFCNLIDPYDFVGWKSAIEKYISDPELVENMRGNIKAKYKVETWSEVIHEFMNDVALVSNRSAGRL